MSSETDGDAVIVQVRMVSFIENLFERYKLVSITNQHCHDPTLNKIVIEMHNNNTFLQAYAHDAKRIGQS